MSSAIACPHCGSAASGNASITGHVAVCIHCRQQFMEDPRPDLHAGSYFSCTVCGGNNPAGAITGSALQCQRCGRGYFGPPLLTAPPSAPAYRPPPRRESSSSSDGGGGGAGFEVDSWVIYLLIFGVINAILFFTTGWVVIPK